MDGSEKFHGEILGGQLVGCILRPFVWWIVHSRVVDTRVHTVRRYDCCFCIAASGRSEYLRLLMNIYLWAVYPMPNTGT